MISTLAALSWSPAPQPRPSSSKAVRPPGSSRCSVQSPPRSTSVGNVRQRDDRAHLLALPGELERRHVALDTVVVGGQRGRADQLDRAVLADEPPAGAGRHRGGDGQRADGDQSRRSWPGRGAAGTATDDAASSASLSPGVRVSGRDWGSTTRTTAGSRRRATSNLASNGRWNRDGEMRCPS